MRQSSLSFAGAKPSPLVAVSGNKRAPPPPTEILASSPPSPKRRRRSPAPAVSIPAFAAPPFPAPPPAPTHWVEDVPRSRWEAALGRLVDGYVDKSGSGYPAAATNGLGCLLGQKGTNRLENGYLQVTPVVPVGAGRARRGGERKEREKPFGAHRVAVLLHHPSVPCPRAASCLRSRLIQGVVLKP